MPSKMPAWWQMRSATIAQVFAGRDDSWNLRDEHMSETLAALVKHSGVTREGDFFAQISHWAIPRQE